MHIFQVGSDTAKVTTRRDFGLVAARSDRAIIIVLVLARRCHNFQSGGNLKLRSRLPEIPGPGAGIEVRVGHRVPGFGRPRAVSVGRARPGARCHHGIFRDFKLKFRLPGPVALADGSSSRHCQAVAHANPIQSESRLLVRPSCVTVHFKLKTVELEVPASPSHRHWAAAIESGSPCPSPPVGPTETVTVQLGKNR